MKLVNYIVTMATGDLTFAGTFHNVYIKLVGTDGESDHIWLESLNGPLSFIRGAVSSFTVSCPVSIGKLILIEIDKQPHLLFFEDSWFPAKVEVKSPEGDTYNFPTYRWITDSEVHLFREATALRVFEDDNPLSKYSREQELKQREEDYRWDVYVEGIPHCIMAEGIFSLPDEVRFSFTKTTEFFFTEATGLAELQLKGLSDCTKNWPNIDAIHRVFCCKRTNMSEYVQKHWKEDTFFGYQFLNGVNPMLIQRCSVLPKNFPVSDDMIFLGGHCSLAGEMKKGNVFLCDYKHLDGIKTNIINGKKQYLMAPLVLLHKTPDDQLMPVAIQLKQIPADDNPIFFPTDTTEYDWLTAKIFVRSADFNEHQLNAHLLRTHLLAEVFAVSLLRNMPMVHPLYKLLVPHTRYTLQINNLARGLLISETGIFTRFAASGGEGMRTLLKRSLSSVTYRSLCIPDDIVERGLEDVPNFYYRDDGLKLWDIIHRFVKGVLRFYYKDDTEVQKDSELQKWISDIFEHGFLSQAGTGIPESFTTVTELVKFVTMVIFTCSGQHSAVNTGQFDDCGWMPNTPLTLQRPPPTTKGTTSEATMLQTLPAVNATVQIMSTVWLLSRQSTDSIPLGKYPEEHFSEKIPCKLIQDFQGELQVLSAIINARNKSLEVPYTYLDPMVVENSVSI
ncbi:LOW QUALITY PROTEIN: polyunsaturated fatty acid lipoxygenase ALOX15B-like [Cebidichthys violaceus]|uniref:LOW QUALITY PROTEIN: polyunsaturated fatty acid lipoxygenase ALOX15B-like n=1 Tax=Cebidichthys violaceus TaxID=271503 RepID=UPI0035CBAC11